MRSRRSGVLAGAVVAMLAAVAPDGAVADEFVVESCKGDRLNYSTTVFEDFATRGMRIRRACNPEGAAESNDVAGELAMIHRRQAVGVVGAPVAARIWQVRQKRLREHRQLCGEVGAPRGTAAVEHHEWRAGPRLGVGDLDSADVDVLHL